MEFSPYGLAFSLVLLAPSLLLVRWPPRRPIPRVRVAWPLATAERSGQALTLALPPFSAVTAPLAPAQAVLGIVTGVLLLGYGSLWVRYLVRGREPELLYGRWGGVPVPLAVLPVLAVAACAGWSGSPWILAAAAILAAGHVPISLRIARSLRNTPRDIPHQREAE
ncbi:hypothetical protein [Microbacterium sp.]|uniref:hypothetical protein n=1 Tax=Microbacterium sp. TaxID=51671 RepID=UPI0039E26B57